MSDGATYNYAPLLILQIIINILIVDSIHSKRQPLTERLWMIVVLNAPINPFFAQWRFSLNAPIKMHNIKWNIAHNGDMLKISTNQICPMRITTISNANSCDSFHQYHMIFVMRPYWILLLRTYLISSPFPTNFKWLCIHRNISSYILFHYGLCDQPFHDWFKMLCISLWLIQDIILYTSLWSNALFCTCILLLGNFCQHLKSRISSLM